MYYRVGCPRLLFLRPGGFWFLCMLATPLVRFTPFRCPILDLLFEAMLYVLSHLAPSKCPSSLMPPPPPHRHRRRARRPPPPTLRVRVRWGRTFQGGDGIVFVVVAGGGRRGRIVDRRDDDIRIKLRSCRHCRDKKPRRRRSSWWERNGMGGVGEGGGGTIVVASSSFSIESTPFAGRGQRLARRTAQ